MSEKSMKSVVLLLAQNNCDKYQGTKLKSPTVFRLISKFVASSVYFTMWSNCTSGPFQLRASRIDKFFFPDLYNFFYDRGNFDLHMSIRMC